MPELRRRQRGFDSLRVYLQVLDVLENDGVYVNLSPMGEPQLGKRGFYPPVGAQGAGTDLMAKLWVLNLSGGQHGLIDIAERARLPFPSIPREAAGALLEGGLLALV